MSTQMSIGKTSFLSAGKAGEIIPQKAVQILRRLDHVERTGGSKPTAIGFLAATSGTRGDPAQSPHRQVASV
jgi:hypothetical protein